MAYTVIDGNGIIGALQASVTRGRSAPSTGPLTLAPAVATYIAVPAKAGAAVRRKPAVLFWSEELGRSIGVLVVHARRGAGAGVGVGSACAADEQGRREADGLGHVFALGALGEVAAHRRAGHVEPLRDLGHGERPPLLAWPRHPRLVSVAGVKHAREALGGGAGLVWVVRLGRCVEDRLERREGGRRGVDAVAGGGDRVPELERDRL